MATVSVLGSTMHYSEVGRGDAVVFIHGNPTSSYLWRNITGVVARAGYRCIAVDLIGMGQSGRSQTGYRLKDHIDHVHDFLKALDLRSVTLVGHDWGAVIALAIARRRAGWVHSVAIMEGHIHPIESSTDFGDDERELFSALRDTEEGERLILEENFFVESILPAGVSRPLSNDEMDAYREPFASAQSRLPILQWIREIPIDGHPADVTEIVVKNQSVLLDSNMPTLVLHGGPGSLIGSQEVDWCLEQGRSLTVEAVGEGTHFLPEDQSVAIADALVRWLYAVRT